MFIFCLKVLLAGAITLGVGAKRKNNDPSQKYISDTRLVYAANVAEAKSKLPEGFELASSSALYEYTEGTAENTYLAVKKTDEISEAITDIRAMNMVGGWSTNSYENLLKEQKTEIGRLVTQVKPAIQEFRDKYEKGIEMAKKGKENGASLAALILNSLHDDDTIDPKTEKPMTLLEMFLNPSYCTDEKLTTIFMQGNNKAVFAMETALSYATVALNVDGSKYFDLKNFANYKDLQDCTECDPTGTLRSEEIDIMIDSINDLKKTLSYFYKSGFAEHPENFTEENIKTYLSCLTVEDGLMFQVSAELYALLDDYIFMADDPMFGDGKLSTFVINFDENANNFDENVVKPFIMEMSNAQRNCYYYGGLDSLLIAINNENKTCKYSAESGKDPEPYLNTLVIEYKNLLTEKGITSASVYAGVDRRIFEAKGIALTSAAMREQNAKNDFNWFKTNEEAEVVLDHIVKVCFTVSCSLLGLCALTYLGCVWNSLAGMGISGFNLVFCQGTFSTCCKFWAEEPLTAPQIKTAENAQLIYRSPYGEFTEEQVIRECRKNVKIMKVLKVVAAVAGVVMAVAMIVAFAKEIITVSESSIEYVDIPEIMVDEKLINDEVVYSYYYNIKDTDDNVADVTKASSRKHTQWVSLYYTKDKSCGNAILANSFTVINDAQKALDKTGISKFGELGIYNLTKYTKKDAPVSFVAFEGVNILDGQKVSAVTKLTNYAGQLFEVYICEVPSIMSSYIKRISDAHNGTEVNNLLTEAMNALNAEKIENYDVVYPVYKKIEELGNITLESKAKVEEARKLFDALSIGHQEYVSNYRVLLTAEKTIYNLQLDQDKLIALEDVKQYINKQTNLGSDEEKAKLYAECQEVIKAANTQEELLAAKQIAFDKVDAKVAEKESQAASTFGKGNLGLLFIGLTSGIVVGVLGIWLTLRYLKKGKEKKDSKPEENK